mgnify:CR=1 FL=1
MLLLFTVIWTLLGLLIGSFLNVVSLRFNTGRSLEGRSGCYSCGHKLRWYELVPVLSWLIQKGRCRSCKSNISPLYVLGEITTGILFAGIAVRAYFYDIVDILSFGYLSGTLFLSLIFSILVVILLYDIRHKIIPDSLSFIFGLLSFISIFLFADGFVFVPGFTFEWMQVLAGLIIPLPFALVWLFSKGRLIGLGDPKLMIGIGLLLGIPLGFTAVVLSFWIGAGYAIIIMLVNWLGKKQLLLGSNKRIMKAEVPFAPFLIIGTWYVVMTSFNLFVI